jgi:hypothetical protein
LRSRKAFDAIGDAVFSAIITAQRAEPPQAAEVKAA